MFRNIMYLKNAKTKRFSSYDVTGRNNDAWNINPGETRVLADIKGPGLITHIWMTQGGHYRDVLIKITWDDAKSPSILCPLGDFFGLGHAIVNSYQSFFFTASTANNNKSETGCALNCYLPMPFKKRALVELINESKFVQRQYFYIDYELYNSEQELGTDWGYLHAEFHRENPFGGWGHEIKVNSLEADIVNKERLAWDNNLVILETKGRGHYIGCNYSVTNFQGTWWGEGDDMIWVDGYKWPPDLHGTGSEDYLNQAWGMQNNAFLRNGSSIFEHATGGYQTSYIFHIENPVRFEKEIKVTIEFGHGNHLRNECCTVAYWYAEKPTAIRAPPPVEKRQPVKKINGKWVNEQSSQITSREIPLNEEMKLMKGIQKQRDFPYYVYQIGTLSLDSDKRICLKTYLTRDNPILYDIPLSEILEYFINKEIVIELISDVTNTEENARRPDREKLINLPKPTISYEGRLEMSSDENLQLVQGNNVNSFNDIIPDKIINKKIELETLIDMEDKSNQTQVPIKYKIQIRYKP